MTRIQARDNQGTDQTTRIDPGHMTTDTGSKTRQQMSQERHTGTSAGNQPSQKGKAAIDRCAGSSRANIFSRLANSPVMSYRRNRITQCHNLKYKNPDSLCKGSFVFFHSYTVSG